MICLLNSSIFELSIGEKTSKSIEHFVEDWPPNALRFYTTAERNRHEKRKLFAELRDEFVNLEEAIVQLILSKRTKNGGEFVYLKTTTKFIRKNDQFILNGKLYQSGQSSELSVRYITFQLVEAKGKQRIEEFKLELNEFEQSDDTFILLEAKMIRRKGEGLFANLFKIINRIERTETKHLVNIVVCTKYFKYLVIRLLKVKECKHFRKSYRKKKLHRIFHHRSKQLFDGNL